MNGDRLVTAEEWAASVRADEPHGLREVEEHVLGGTSGEAASSGVRGILFSTSMVVTLAAPVAGVLVFFDRSDALHLDYDFSPDTSFRVSAVAFTLALMLQVGMVTEWWRERHRNQAALWMSAGFLVCGAWAWWLGSEQAGNTSLDASLFLIPAWVSIAISVLLIVVNALSRPLTAADQEAWQVRQELAQAKLQAVEGDLAELPPASRDALLADRRRALETLAARGLLTGVDIDELSRRPLGELAASDEDER